MSAVLVDIRAWCVETAARFREWDEGRLPLSPDARDGQLAEFVVKALGNPDIQGSAQIVTLLGERHGGTG